MKQKKLSPHKLVNGNLVRPPKKGEAVGERVEVFRRPTDAVEFGFFRSAAVYVRFYDKVYTMAMDANGMFHGGYHMESAGTLDVRDDDTSIEIIALIKAGGAAATALRRRFDLKQTTKEAAAKRKKRSAA